MKTKIELSFEAFKRWLGNSTLTPRSTGDHPVSLIHAYMDQYWQDLCAEAEKRDPVVRWAIISIKEVVPLYFYHSKEAAKEHFKSWTHRDNYKIIKLVEVQE